MGIDWRVIRAIARRELGSYLGNPAGYVFLTLFIAATGAGAFLQAGFFARNLADLALLNKVMPAILMLFVPAVTMNVWAEERRRGTDELLLTLPVRDLEVVLGKYLGALGVYTVGLLFALAHVIVLRQLGDPDLGLMFSTYLGYGRLHPRCARLRGLGVRRHRPVGRRDRRLRSGGRRGHARLGRLSRQRRRGRVRGGRRWRDRADRVADRQRRGL